MITLPPLFSVVIPWNSDLTSLQASLKSVRQQTLQDFDVHIIAYGGAQRRVEAMEASDKYQDCRFHTLRDGNLGRALNQAIGRARGEWIAFLKPGDRFASEKLARFGALVPETNADLMWSRGRAEHGSAPFPSQIYVPGEDLGEYLFSRGAHVTLSGLVARRAIAETAMFSGGVNYYQTADFLLRAAFEGADAEMLEDVLYETRADRIRLEHRHAKHHDGLMSWAAGMRPALSDRAYWAFAARHVARYRFPRRFWWSLKTILRGCARGGVPYRTGAMFILAGLNPFRTRMMRTKKPRVSRRGREMA